MRLRNITGAREVISESPYVVQEEMQPRCAGNWKNIFGNRQPVHIEIGMGKGKFIHTMAKEHPDINYVGIEKYSSVLLRAVRKMEQEYLPNLKFLRIEAENIAVVFGPGEVERIYLNFSDPWPKDRHAKRRLPSRDFLARYDRILSGDGSLEFKTDNRELFDFGLEELKAAGWELEALTYDLHSDEKLMQGNVMTEYEEKFSSMGKPICKFGARRISGARGGAAPGDFEGKQCGAEKREKMEYKLTTDNFETEVLNSPIPVLVDFYADWCNPCRMMGPVVAKIAEEYEGKVKVGKCNIDENMELAGRYRVSSIPAFIIFKDGKPAADFVGAMTAADLKQKVDQVLG